MQETVRVQLNFALERVKEPSSGTYPTISASDFRSVCVDRHRKGRLHGFDLTGERDDINSGLAWAQEQGVEISALGINGANEWAI
jgi:hypothetical protein